LTKLEKLADLGDLPFEDLCGDFDVVGVGVLLAIPAESQLKLFLLCGDFDFDVDVVGVGVLLAIPAESQLKLFLLCGDFDFERSDLDNRELTKLDKLADFGGGLFGDDETIIYVLHNIKFV
jgi:hypothetical protein